MAIYIRKFWFFSLLEKVTFSGFYIYLLFYSVKNLNLNFLAKASLSQSKDELQQVVENLKVDYVSINQNEYDNFKVNLNNP